MKGTDYIMDKQGIKRVSGKFVLYLSFVLFFPVLLIFVFGVVWALTGWKLNTPFIISFIIFDIAMLCYVLVGTDYFFHKLPYKRSLKLVQQYRDEGFPFSYYLNYKQDFWIVDEVNGRLAVVTEKNPYCFQIVDAADIESANVYPSNVKKWPEIGVIIEIRGKRHKAYTFNGRGFRLIRYINMESDLAKASLQKAYELAEHITKAKEVALRKKGIL